MKRLHVHVGVDDLAASTRFYSTLFGTPPTLARADYAKWMLEDPRVNFAISQGRANRGVEHLGIQVEDEAELEEVYARLKAADRPVLDEGATTCCYANSTKQWIADPQGVVWEAFLTHGETTVYGGAPALASLAPASAAAPSPNPAERAATAAPACCAGGRPSPA